MEITMDQIQRLSEQYEESGLGETSSGRFLKSILKEGTMPRGRGISWLEDLVSKGSPASVAPLLAEIDDLISRTPRNDTKGELTYLRNRVKAGWLITVYQQKELDRLRQQVNDAKPDLELTDRQKELLAGMSNRLRYSSSAYWAARPAISKRLGTIFHRWETEKKISPDDWQFARDNFKSVVSEFEGTRHPVGALRWEKGYHWAVTVMSEPRMTDTGEVIVDVLTPKGVISIPVIRLFIRAPK